MTEIELANNSGITVETVTKKLATVPGVLNGNIPNGTSNLYGANNYDTTIEYDQKCKGLNKRKFYKYIGACLGSAIAMYDNLKI